MQALTCLRASECAKRVENVMSADRPEKKNNLQGTGKPVFQGPDRLIEQVPGHLVVDVHDLADLVIAEILVVFEIDDLFLPAAELFQGPEDAAFLFLVHFFGDKKAFMAP